MKNSNGTLLVQSIQERFEEFDRIAEQQCFGHEIIDFALPMFINDPEEALKRLSCYKEKLEGRDLSKYSMHGVFIDVRPESQDILIRDASRKRIRQNLDYAQELGIGRIVFHCSFNPLVNSAFYENLWLSGSIDCWTEMINEFKGIILLENLYDETPEMLCRVLEGVDNERLKICLDVGHCNCYSKTGLKTWFRELGHKIEYFHLTDNDGSKDQHQPAGSGSIDWNLFTEQASSLDSSPDAVLEVRTVEDVEQSISFLKNNRIYPFNQ